jgi:hypothetical protein
MVGARNSSEHLLVKAEAGDDKDRARGIRSGERPESFGQARLQILKGAGADLRPSGEISAISSIVHGLPRYENTSSI